MVATPAQTGHAKLTMPPLAPAGLAPVETASQAFPSLGFVACIQGRRAVGDSLPRPGGPATISTAGRRASARRSAGSSAMFVLPTFIFREPIRKSAGCQIYSGRVYSRRPLLRERNQRSDHTTRNSGTPMLECGLSKTASPRHCGGGIFLPRHKRVSPRRVPPGFGSRCSFLVWGHPRTCRP